MLAVVVAVMVARRTPRRSLAIVGLPMALMAIVLYRVTPNGAIDLVIGVAFGVGLGLMAPWHWAERGSRARQSRSDVAIALAGSALTVGLVLWVAANDPTVLWFGHITTHGDRQSAQVALTFDDGPDDPYSLEVSRVLDEHGVKGTFFEVGKAVDAEPGIARALYDDGQLIGNHSYHHDYWRWLDPRYPELDRTQEAFRRQLGVCPAFFRPPHGQRTPFMLAHVSSKGMHAVTWDVSAGDWATDDPALVAQRILDGVKPGSIILLHDGIDGTVTANRAVLVKALPMIIDGLKAKGLTPVRLDELLDRPGYLDHC